MPKAYAGDKPPSAYPDAQKSAKDGYWYIKQGEKWMRVMDTRDDSDLGSAPRRN